MLQNIAVLIDADNISSQKIDWVFSKIQTLGTVTTKRIYGDFAKSHLSSWESTILKYAIEKRHQTSYSTGKNSSDIALAIDAMDLLYSNQCDAFCVVSSDSDFIGLTMRIRRNNIQVFGFGENKTIKEFRQVCSRFFEIPNTQLVSASNNTIDKSIPKFTVNQLKCDSKLLNALRESIEKSLKKDWANYSQITGYLQKNYVQLKPSQYGYEKWSEILLLIDLFEHKKLNNTVFFRLKNNKLNNTQVPVKQTADQLQQDTVLISAIKESIAQHTVNGWTDYSLFNSYLNTKFSNLKVEQYGYSKWRTLIKQIDLFEFKLVGSKLFIREKITEQDTKINVVEQAKNIKLNNQQLLNDILQIINENTVRADEWVHIGYLGSQLKNRGYQPKDYGFKSFPVLLENTDGVMIRKNGSIIYSTLSDKSKIRPIKPVEEGQISSNQGLEDTNFYKLLISNKIQIYDKIKKLLDEGIKLKFYELWLMVHKSVPSHILLADKESYECFMYFFKRNLTHFTLKLDNDVLYVVYKIA